jgi:hypothetical protein
VISLYAWSGGLAVVVEAAYRRRAALFGPDGWRVGDPADVLPEGAPSGAEGASLALPAWLIDQLPMLDLMFGGLHTDFVRLDRLLGRLQAQGADGAVLVLGERPAVVVVQGGVLRAIEPALPEGAPVLPALGTARGWILVYGGKVGVPVAKTTPRPREVAEREAAAPSGETPAPPAVGVTPRAAPAPATPAAPPAPPPPATPAAPPAAEAERHTADERFVAAPAARSLPEGMAARIRAEAGDGAPAVLALLDGSRTLADVAGAAGITVDRAGAIVRVLVAHRLAFRYISRVRPATARGPR